MPTFLLNPTVMLALALALAIAAVSHYRSELLVVEAQYSGFKMTVEAEGKAAKAHADATIAKSELEKSNVQATLVSTLADNKRLLSDAARARASRGYLPAVPAGTADSGRAACFDRAKLESALSSFGTGVAGLIAEGADASIIRDGWHRWYDGQASAYKIEPSTKEK